MAVWPWIVGLVVAVAILVPLLFYNRAVVLRNRSKEAWANVETELKRRYELIPNLVATVKGYASHEREVLDQVVRLRTDAMHTGGPAGRQAEHERPLVRALDRLLAVAEAYPELKASRNFLKLQHELAITEDRIQAARRFYNANVREYRDHTQQFPGSVFARWFRLPPIEFFEVDPIVHSVPAVRMGAV